MESIGLNECGEMGEGETGDNGCKEENRREGSVCDLGPAICGHVRQREFGVGRTPGWWVE